MLLASSWHDICIGDAVADFEKSCGAPGTAPVELRLYSGNHIDHVKHLPDLLKVRCHPLRESCRALTQ